MQTRLWELLSIPLAGIKRADFVSTGDRRGGFVRLELLVGGQLDVRLNVSKPREVIRRLQGAAERRYRLGSICSVRGRCSDCARPL